MTAAATVLRYIETADPTQEVVVLTATDGEQYFSRKFAKITAAIACGNDDNDAHINVGFGNAADNIAEINYASQTDQTVTLVLWGE